MVKWQVWPKKIRNARYVGSNSQNINVLLAAVMHAPDVIGCNSDYAVNVQKKIDLNMQNLNEIKNHNSYIYLKNIILQGDC